MYYATPTQIGKILRFEHGISKDFFTKAASGEHISRRGKITGTTVNPVLLEMGLQILTRPYAVRKAILWVPTEKAVDLGICYVSNDSLFWDSEIVPLMLIQYIKEKEHGKEK